MGLIGVTEMELENRPQKRRSGRKKGMWCFIGSCWSLWVTLKVCISQMVMSFFKPTSPHTARIWGTIFFGAQSIEQRETEEFKNALNARNLQQTEMKTQARRGVCGVGWVVKKALDEACTSCLCLSSLYFFLIYHMYVFFYQQRIVWTKLREKAKCVCECEGNGEKSPKNIFSPGFFFFFVTIQDKTVYYPPLRKDSPACHCQGNCWGDNDCVIKNGWQVLLSIFFLNNFSYILLLLSL